MSLILPNSQINASGQILYVLVMSDSHLAWPVLFRSHRRTAGAYVGAWKHADNRNSALNEGSAKAGAKMHRDLVMTGG